MSSGSSTPSTISSWRSGNIGGIDGGVVTTIAKGKVRGPRVLSCGPVQCQIGGHGYDGAAWEPTELWSGHHLPGLSALSMMSGNADELRGNVREAFRRGASFLKLCVTGGVVGAHDRLTDTRFTVDEIAVAVQEAAARGTYVTVHAHNNQGIRNAVEAGARCVEHGTDLDEATATLMATHDVALVPTFAVVEKLLHDPCGRRPRRVGPRPGDGCRGTDDRGARRRQGGRSADRAGFRSHRPGPGPPG